jgi:choline dehydrogenase-like flavoprotein
VIFKFGLRDPFLNDYLPQVKGAANVTTYLYANVIEIETDETAQNVTRLQAACLDGAKFSVSAKLFILATGAIETPRLLLASNRTQDAGLGNHHDLVGRFFMEHPHYELGIFVPSTPEIFRLTRLYDHINRINGVHVLGKLALSEETLRREKLLNYVAELVPRVIRYSTLGAHIYPTITSDSIRAFKAIRSSLRGRALPEGCFKNFIRMAEGIDDIAATAYRNIRRKGLRTFNKKKIQVFRLGNMSEQVPNPMSRITLSPEKDRLGQNRACLDWRLSPIDIQSAVRSQEILGKELSQAGLGRLYIELNDETPPQRIGGGWHQMGTTRMHRNPTKGVVDENCKVHGISNLYVSGPSVFPTSGYANPVLTIVALAERLADHVKKLLP